MHPPLRHDELLLRPLVADDAPGLYAAVHSSIVSLSYWFPWCHPDYALSDAQAWVAQGIAAWEERTGFPMGIFDEHDGALLGCVGLSQVDRVNSSANLGYWVGEPHRGKGIATRAALLCASLAFENLGFERLEIVALVHNRASQRVAEKVGATRAAFARDRLVFQGRPAAAFVYSLTPADAHHRHADPR